MKTSEIILDKVNDRYILIEKYNKNIVNLDFMQGIDKYAHEQIKTCIGQTNTSLLEIYNRLQENKPYINREFNNDLSEINYCIDLYTNAFIFVGHDLNEPTQLHKFNTSKLTNEQKTEVLSLIQKFEELNTRTFVAFWDKLHFTINKDAVEIKQMDFFTNEINGYHEDDIVQIQALKVGEVWSMDKGQFITRVR